MFLCIARKGKRLYLERLDCLDCLDCLECLEGFERLVRRLPPDFLKLSSIDFFTFLLNSARFSANKDDASGFNPCSKVGSINILCSE